MELQYVKALKENNLQISQLPEDARTGIDTINEIQRALNLVAQKGRKPSEKSLKKLRAMDKWVYYEILDFVEGSNNNSANPLPEGAKKVVEEIKKEEGAGGNEGANAGKEKDDKAAQTGLKIDEELKALHAAAVTEITLDDLQQKAKTTYSVIFENYEEGGENGVVTSFYELREKEPKLFTLKKK